MKNISSCSFITGNLSALHCGITVFNALCSVVNYTYALQALKSYAQYTHYTA